jgi:DNA-binding IclR family transcriptional regulator
VINYSRIAGRLPLHVSSSGLVLLAHGPRDLQERILARPLVSYTANTICSAPRLRAVLAEIRRQGFAFCPGHVHEDALGIAVPITVRTRESKPAVVAALSAIVPVTSDGKAVTAVLAAAARGIGRTLAASA